MSDGRGIVRLRLRKETDMRIISLDEVSRKEILDQLLKRSPNHYGQYLDTVAEIVERVRREGDAALFEYTNRFDCPEIDASNIQVTESELKEAYEKVVQKLLMIIR